MNIVIDKASLDDLSAVLDLTMEHARFNAGFDPDYYSLTENAESEYRDVLQVAIQDNNQAVLVARSEEEVVGCVQTEMRKIPIFKRGSRGLIYNLYVKRMWRRRGIGGRLMEEATSWLQNRGAEMVFLNVASQNTEAKLFYEKLGFKTVNENMYRLI